MGDVEVDPLLAPGRLIGGYRLEQRVGGGGMGTVHVAVEPSIGKRVAVKVLRRELSGDPSFGARFLREAQSVGRIRHPAVVEIFSFGALDDGRPYFVMPLLEGKSLRDAIAPGAAMDAGDAWRIAREIGRGLAAAHAAGVLHRDLKPDNVFLVHVADRPAQPVLLDFGLAKIVDAGGDDAMKLSHTGAPMGTPRYMAPEQWWSRPATAATDQYAFGVVLFELLAGRPPFEGTTFPELLEAHLHRTPPRLRALGVDVPEPVDAFVQRLLAKEPGERFSDFGEVLAVGDAAFAGRSAPAREQEVARADTGAGAAPPLHATANVEAKVEVPASQEPALAPRAIAQYIAAAASVGALLPAVGYPGDAGRDVAEWMRDIGYGWLPIVAAGLLSLALLPRVVRRARERPALGLVALALAVSPAFLALLPTYTGWHVVVRAAQSPEPAQSFGILHEGFYEVSVIAFVALGLTAALATGLAWLLGNELARDASPTASPSSPPRVRLAWALAAASAGLGAVAATQGLRSAALLLVGTAVQLAVLRWRPHRSPREAHLAVDRLLAVVLATVALAGVAFTRVEAASASSFVGVVPRATRVAALVASGEDRDWTGRALALALALLACGAWVTRAGGAADPHVTRAVRARAPRGAMIAGGALVLLALVEAFVSYDFARRRGELVASMREQLVFFASLVPPAVEPGVALPDPGPATALQVSVHAVAVNGKGIGRLAALDSEEGRRTIRDQITMALAASEGAADLSLLADRHVPAERLRDLLAIAYDSGARRVDLLLTRGPLPDVPKGAPPEAGHVLPMDFGALRVTLVPGDGGEGGEYEPMARDLQRRGQPAYLQVHAGARGP